MTATKETKTEEKDGTACFLERQSNLALAEMSCEKGLYTVTYFSPDKGAEKKNVTYKGKLINAFKWAAILSLKHGIATVRYMHPFTRVTRVLATYVGGFPKLPDDKKGKK